MFAVTWGLASKNIGIIKFNKKILFSYIALFFAISSLIEAFALDRLLIPLVASASFLFLYRVFKAAYFSLLNVLSSIVIFMASDGIAALIYEIILNMSIIEIRADKRLFFYTGLFICGTAYYLSLVVGKIMETVIISSENRKLYYRQGISLILSLATVVAFGVLASYVYSHIPQNVLRDVNAIYAAFVVSFFILTVLLTYSSSIIIKNKLESKYKEKELINTSEYAANLEVMTESLRSFRHDYLNILQVIGAYIKDKDLSGLEQFYKEELQPESYEALVRDKSYMLLQYIKISPLKTLISSKVIKAQAAGLTVNIEIMEDINTTSVKIIDLCRIMGILLDNAIEGTILTEEKLIYIAAVRSDKKTIFIIKNSCTKDTPPVYRIYEKNFSTKGAHRGIGLKTVREIVDKKYNNLSLNTRIIAQNFIQELVINNK
jgi:two-component system sensor histidine kinase AgrC